MFVVHLFTLFLLEYIGLIDVNSFLEKYEIKLKKNNGLSAHPHDSPHKIQKNRFFSYYLIILNVDMHINVFTPSCLNFLPTTIGSFLVVQRNQFMWLPQYKIELSWSISEILSLLEKGKDIKFWETLDATNIHKIETYRGYYWHDINDKQKKGIQFVGSEGAVEPD